MRPLSHFLISRRSLLKGAACAAPFILLPSLGRAASPGEAIAETIHGRIRGSRVDGVEIYRGVPYAGSVSGRNRFGPPPPVVCWGGVRDAFLPGAPAMQRAETTYGLNEPAPAEDCLSLTVWTPAADGGRRPVMFYNHGGGFETGSGSSVMQDGANLARDYDVVVVATNHRLGIFGFLYLDEIAGAPYAGSGCNGLRDINAGLRWVRDNIENFGGDPTNVMIFGESGGGAKTSCLYAMPAAAPYFNKASIESGPGIRMSPVERAAETTAKVLTMLDIAPKDWRTLLDLPAETLFDVQTRLRAAPDPSAFRGGRLGMVRGRLGFAPVVDNVVLVSDPFDPVAPAISRNKPLICGYNRDEFSFMARVSGDVEAFNLDEAGLEKRLANEMPDDYRQAIAACRKSRPDASPADIYIAIRSAEFAGSGSITIAERKTRQGGSPCYAYVFTYALEQRLPGARRPFGAMHALEIPFKFNNPDAVVEGRPRFAGDRPERYPAARNMSTLWANFARDGVPSLPGGPEWTAYDLETRATMMIDAKCTVVDDPTGPEREFWESRPA